MLQQLLIWGIIYNCHNILPYNGVELKFFSFIKIIPETLTSRLLNIKCTVEELLVINVKIVLGFFCRCYLENFHIQDKINSKSKYISVKAMFVFNLKQWRIQKKLDLKKIHIMCDIKKKTWNKKIEFLSYSHFFKLSFLY